jgi:hypothetical protein
MAALDKVVNFNERSKNASGHSRNSDNSISLWLSRQPARMASAGQDSDAKRRHRPGRGLHHQQDQQTCNAFAEVEVGQN